MLPVRLLPRSMPRPLGRGIGRSARGSTERRGGHLEAAVLQLRRAVVATIFVFLASLAMTQSAFAVVTLADASPANAMSCGQGTASAVLLIFNTPYRLNNPAGATTGDLLILTVRTYNETNFLGNSVLPNAQSVAWTPLLSSGTTRTYYRRRLAGDPAQYTVVSVGALVTASAEVEASIVAFSGADPVTPFANAGAQSTGSGTGSVALPNAGVVRGGGMRYSAMSTDRSSTFDYSGASPLTQACNQQNASSSISSSYESGITPATTPSHSVTVGGTAGPAWVAQTYTIQPPLSACASGGANLTAPASVNFPSVTLNGYDQVSMVSAPVTVNDQTGIMAGWNLSATSTPFTSGGNTLPTSASSIVAVTPTAGAGICSLPVNTVLYPLTVPAAIVPPTASRVYNALAGTGSGPVDLSLSMHLAIPSRTRVGTYTSTWTLTLTSGP